MRSWDFQKLCKIESRLQGHFGLDPIIFLKVLAGPQDHSFRMLVYNLHLRTELVPENPLTCFY